MQESPRERQGDRRTANKEEAMWERLFDRFMHALVREGELQVTLPSGVTRRYGNGKGLSAAVSIHDQGQLRRLIQRPELALGEGYMDRRLSVAQDDLEGFLRLVARNVMRYGRGRLNVAAGLPRRVFRHLAQYNPTAIARRNVAHHYDLSNDFYRLMLDRDMQYSCAYFAEPSMSLEEAQEAKKALIARKLRIEPGMRVLDIGCGWGGMALTLARAYGARVLGITLSERQLEVARARAREEGLAERVEFRLLDYRDLDQRFDRVVSVGMLEHVGVPHMRRYFSVVRQALEPDGIALIHTIGRSTPPSTTSPWLRKYIFPGGYIPAVSEVMPAIERAGLFTADLEVLKGEHYARTLAQWRARFGANDKVIRSMFDDRFRRMWRFYLVLSEVGFRELGLVVHHYQLSRRPGATPATRDYLLAGA